jgi:hypothetical protein
MTNLANPTSRRIYEMLRNDQGKSAAILRMEREILRSEKSLKISSHPRVGLRSGLLKIGDEARSGALLGPLS